MKVASVVLALVVSLGLVGRVPAADQACPTAKPEHAGHANILIMGPWNFVKELNLTDEQKAKIKELRQQFEPKFKEAADSILTAEQKKARDEAVKEAKNSGKKGGVFTVKLNLTDEQKLRLKEAVAPLEKELREKTSALLTPEQQKQLAAKMAERKAKVAGHAAGSK